MALHDLTPPNGNEALAKNGYALLTDLEDPEYGRIVQSLERFQAEFLARTRTIWDDGFPIPPDALGHFTRQWEYPYAWANLAAMGGRFLDAGSGFTFPPVRLRGGRVRRRLLRCGHGGDRIRGAVRARERTD